MSQVKPLHVFLKIYFDLLFVTYGLFYIIVKQTERKLGEEEE